MKKYIFLIVILFLAITLKNYSTTWNVTVQNFFFSPANLPNVIVGDTITWQWINGDHTTTSATIPAGAAPWDVSLHVSNQTFSYIVTTSGSYHYMCTPHSPGMAGDFTVNIIGITQTSSEVPGKFELGQNYPNPFNPVTNIEFDIPKSSYVKLSVISLIGKQVQILVDRQMNPGTYSVDWNASDFPSGIYFYKLETESFTKTKRMILLK